MEKKRLKSVGRKPKDVRKTLGRILKYLLGYKFQLFIVVLAIIFSALAGILGTYFLKPLINDYIVPFIGKKNVDLTSFIRMLSIMGIVYILGAASTYAYNRIMVNISTGILKNVRTDLFNHLEDLPIRYFDTHTHGETMSRFTNDTDAIRDMLSQGVPQLISSTITVSGIFIMMIYLSPVLTLFIILMLFVMLFAVKKISSKSSTYFQKTQKSVGEVNGYIEEMIEGQKVIKVFNHEDNVMMDFEKLNEELRISSTGANTFANILMPVMGNLAYANYAITATVGGYLTILGMMDIGTIASFLQYTRSFAQPITQISQQLNSVLAALAGAERIFEIMEEVPEIDEGKVTLVNVVKSKDGTLEETENYSGSWAWKNPQDDGSVKYIQLNGDVRLENVTFGYNPDKSVLKDISLYAKPGQKIAFVGSTGAGKTTITNLINRFYELQEGTIRYDGINITKIKKDDLRRSLSMVLQDTHLFTGTVMENIRYGNLHATDEEVIAASKLANAHSFIKHLPEGYQTILTSDGANLSQGQRQLLAIARAAVANPPVLILDEATSSIDTRTEALIEKGMDMLMTGRTTFVIAHRLSTVRNSNAIMVLENGEIIERGDHESLLKEKGKYYKLYTGMFELT